MKYSYMMPVLAAYSTLLVGLAGVAELIQLTNPPPSSYVLQPAYLPSVFLAPFANDWSDFAGSLVHILAYLVVFAILLEFDPSLKTRGRFRTFFCVIPILGGFVGASLYNIQLYRSDLTSGGAGSSIISAAMTGQLVVLSIVVLADSIGRREAIPAISSTLIAFAMVYVFHGDFLSAGDEMAHLFGFVSGALVAFLYFTFAGLQSSVVAGKTDRSWTFGTKIKRQPRAPTSAIELPSRRMLRTVTKSGRGPKTHQSRPSLAAT